MRIAHVFLALVLAFVAIPMPLARAGEPATPAVTTKALAGAVVLAPGASDEDLGRACKELAREVYKNEKLRPTIDEAAARTLCGGDPGTDAAPKRIAELRQGLGLRVDSAASRVLAQALVDDLGARTLVLLGKDAAGVFTVAVVRAARKDGKVAVFAEPTRIALAPKGEPAAIPWADAASAVAILAEEEGESQSDGSLAPVEVVHKPAPGAAPSGPRKTNLLGARATDAPKQPEGTPLLESPWFWVAVGSVAAVGLTILIVSQTSDVDEGTVRVEGTVPK